MNFARKCSIAIVAASSTICGTVKCPRRGSNSASVTAVGVRVAASANASAARSGSLKNGLSRNRSTAESFSSVTPWLIPGMS